MQKKGDTTLGYVTLTTYLKEESENCEYHQLIGHEL